MFIGLGVPLQKQHRGATIVPTTVGQVATASLVPDTANTSTAKYFNSRSVHVARSAITSLQIAFPNWYVNNASPKVEVASGDTMTFTGSIEYPAGTFTQIRWFGNTSIVTASGGQDLSDPVNISIPNGATFWIRCHGEAGTNANTPFSQQLSLDSARGAAFEFSATSLPDRTMSGTITNNSGNTGIFTPVLIVGPTNARSVLVLGDSRQRGVHETYTSSANRGEIGRAIGGSVAYINAGIAGDTVAGLVASFSRRLSLANYCTHVTCSFGINDLSLSATPASIVAGIQNIAGKLSGKPVYTSTVAPATTSTDGWVTTGNQTAGSTNANRITLNGLIRAGISGLSGYFEIADAVETSRDSGIWKANYTDDGVHAVDLGADAITPVVTPATFVSYAWDGGPTETDADVNSWQVRAWNAGGLVDALSLKATTTFVKGAKTDGFWTAFRRLNLVCGDFATSKVPLVATVGGATDTTVNMTSSDYSLTTGWTTNGSSKHINTGYTPTEELGGISVYLRTTQASNSTAFVPIGCSSASDLFRICANRNAAGGTASGNVSGAWGHTTQGVAGTGGMIAAAYQLTRASATSVALYRNGVSIGTNTTSVTPGDSAVPLTVLGFNVTGPSVIAYCANGSSVSSYACDSGMSSTQAANYYTRIQTFNTTLSRQV